MRKQIDDNSYVELSPVDGNLFELKVCFDGDERIFYLTHEELKAAEALLTISDQ